MIEITHPEACFAAGTLVHTKEGLVPIEDIKVGDLVLSKPENGGKQAYKRVLQTFAHEPQRVIEVGYYKDETKKVISRIVSTLNHPFWVADIGWTPAEDLYANWTRENWLELFDGRHVLASGTTNIYVSDQPGVGWIPSYMGATDRPGFLWDYVNHKLIDTDVDAIDRISNQDALAYRETESGELSIGYIQDQSVYLHLPVYNLEVEDFHTYYVGEHGVWVHNTNCGGLLSLVEQIN